MVFDLLSERPEAAERGYKCPQIAPLRKWIETETALGNPALEKLVQAGGDPSTTDSGSPRPSTSSGRPEPVEGRAKSRGDGVMKRALVWSKAVNADVAKIVRNVPPFPHLRECLDKLHAQADIMCVSATPGEALQREWEEHDIARYARLIAGQEMGSKKEHLQHASGGKYEPDKVLMIGDALGDYKAAKANDALFFPINPGDETASWKLFFDEGIDRFLSGEFRGQYEDKLLTEFRKYLPSTPPWKKSRS
jgi:phosphoglycolate phosphatase-like HAD superfamily hydrolase